MKKNTTILLFKNLLLKNKKLNRTRAHIFLFLLLYEYSPTKNYKNFCQLIRK